MGQGVAYIPRGAADSLMSTRDTEVLIEGPAGTGKSRAVLEKIHTAALKYPGMRALILRKTRESMTESVLVTYEEKVLGPNNPIASGPQRDNRAAYQYPNGSTIVVGGMKSSGRDMRAKLMSTEYDLIASFESTELAESEWEDLLTRLRNGVMPYQQAIADCNPAGPMHWLNMRANRGGMVRLLSRHTDNPVLFDEKGEKTEQGAKYLAVLARLTGVRLLRLLNGKWVAADGGVYEEYNADIHLIDSFPIPPTWRRIRAIDFGYTNPFVCQWWAIDGDGRMYLYRELYKTKTLVEDHAKRILALSAGEQYEATVSDHDAEDRATLDRHGIDTMPAFKGVESGIQAVGERLRIAGDGKPRLFLMRGALVERDESLEEQHKPSWAAEEIEGYVYPKGQDGKPIKEEPVKVDDHSMDTMRYAVAYVDDVGGERVSFTSGGTWAVASN
jgi:PBSX family phage terminase large subunit